MNDELSAVIAAELERQDAAFDEVKAALSELGDVELRVPQALLDQLDELASPPKLPAGFISVHAIRG